MMLRIFSCAYWLFVYPLWRNVFSNLLPDLFIFFNCENSLYFLIQVTCNLKILSPILRIVFSLNGIFYSTKVFSFGVIQFTCFCSILMKVICFQVLF